MEGKFASDGLQAIDEGDDILMAMARELVTEKGIGESADAVWKRLVEKQAEVFGVRPVETREPEIEAEPPGPDLAGSHHSTGSTDPGSSDATPDVRYVARGGTAAQGFT